MPRLPSKSGIRLRKAKSRKLTFKIETVIIRSVRREANSAIYMGHRRYEHRINSSEASQSGWYDG